MNRELVLKTLDLIERDLAHWDQEQFVQNCGTTMCFGGWALHLSGYAPVQSWSDVGFEAPDGRKIHFSYDIEDAAQQVLGFDDDQAYQVFYWQPEDHFGLDEDSEVTGTREEWFEKFRDHVLAVTEIKEGGGDEVQ